jgi:hypothetical protein
MLAQAVATMLAHERIDAPLALEAARLVGLSGTALARVLGVTPASTTNWLNGHEPMPIQRQRVVLEIAQRIAGLPDPVDPAHIAARRAALVRDAVLKLIDLGRQELPKPTAKEKRAAELDAYKSLARLGIKRIDPLAVLDQASG